MGTKFRQLILSIGLPIGFALVVVAPLRVYASTPSQALTISPDTINEVVQPGSTNLTTLAIKNQGSNSYDYNVYATPYSVSGENYTPDFGIPASSTNIASWFHVEVTQGYLKPGSTASISYTINVPKNILAGGYYGAVFVQTSSPASGQSKTAFQIKERVGQLVYLQVAGPVAEKGRVASWGVSFLQKPPVEGVLKLENSGRVHYTSNINVSFDDIFGNPKYNYTGQYVVLPNTIRRVMVTWPNPPPIGFFKVTGTASVYGATQLSTKYILVVSFTSRIVIAIVAGLVIATSIIRVAARRSIKSKKASRVSKDD